MYRDLRWPYFPADLSWLTGNFINPLNCGQYVNNESPGKNILRSLQFKLSKAKKPNQIFYIFFKDFPCNVIYQECDLPLDIFPVEYRCYLPNIYYSTSEYNQANFLRIVALVAIQDIETDTELLSTYYTVVHG